MQKRCKLMLNESSKITHQEFFENNNTYVNSYASTYDDIIIYNLLGGEKNGFYIDIGAFDPNSGSNTKLLYDLGWHGVNVEPNELMFLKIFKNRPRDINLNYAVSDCKNQEITWYQTCNDFWGTKAHEQSTIVKEVAKYREEKTINQEYKEVYNVSALGKEWQKYMENIAAQGDKRYIHEFKIKTITLKQIFESFCVNKTIDYLSIDVEGAEDLILNGDDFKLFRPRIIECEDNKPYMKRQNISDLITSLNYTFVYEDAIGVNKYFVRNEDLEKINLSLDRCFLYPVDRYTSAS